MNATITITDMGISVDGLTVVLLDSENIKLFLCDTYAGRYNIPQRRLYLAYHKRPWYSDVLRLVTVRDGRTDKSVPLSEGETTFNIENY